MRKGGNAVDEQTGGAFDGLSTVFPAEAGIQKSGRRPVRKPLDPGVRRANGAGGHRLIHALQTARIMPPADPTEGRVRDRLARDRRGRRAFPLQVSGP
jgi:hypothetical protein